MTTAFVLINFEVFSHWYLFNEPIDTVLKEQRKQLMEPSANSIAIKNSSNQSISFPQNDPFNVLEQDFQFRFMRSPSTPIDVLHIPKTGGTSMTASLRDWNIPTRTNVEGNWHMNEYRDSDYVFIIFREPTSHMVSQWKWCRQEGIPYNEIMRRVPFNSWINYWSYRSEHFNGSLEAEIFANYADYHFCWKQLANPDGFKIPVEPDPFQCCHIPLNKQATTLGAFDINSIRTRVLQLFHVGVMDLYRETLCVLDYKVHNRTAEQCTCEGSDAEMHHVNAAKDRKFDPEPADVILETADEKDIQNLIQLDQIAYDLSRERLLWEIQYIQKHFDESFLCSQE